MPEMWEQEGLGCAGPRLRGDIQKELRGRRVALSRTITPGRHLRFATIAL